MSDSGTTAFAPVDRSGPRTPGESPWQRRREECAGMLQALVTCRPEVGLACLSMVDGRVFASSSATAVDPQRIAALGSSLLAISESFSKDVAGGGCHHTTISMDDGSIVTVRVPMTPALFVLSVRVGRAANLAMALRWTLDAASQLAIRLGGQDDHRL